MDDVSIRLSCRGGEAGGVTGMPPGEHIGICLLGIAAGVPRDDVLMDMCGGGVAERAGMSGGRATAAAMVASECRQDGAMEARDKCRLSTSDVEASVGLGKCVLITMGR